MKVTVCELANRPDQFEQDWRALCEHVRLESSELVLLPEMPFHPWLASANKFDEGLWQASVTTSEKWISRLAELAPATVLATRPVVRNRHRLNEGFSWDTDQGYRAIHCKYYLPDEEGFWEASWYDRGQYDFSVARCRQATVGFLICTELWFNQHARAYADRGVHLIVCPRATPRASVDKWIAGGRTAAVVSGAFCLSSNLHGTRPDGAEWGGCGWIIEPEEGEVIGKTSEANPLLTMEIDLNAAVKAKMSYPRYVRP